MFWIMLLTVMLLIVAIDGVPFLVTVPGKGMCSRVNDVGLYLLMQLVVRLV